MQLVAQAHIHKFSKFKKRLEKERKKQRKQIFTKVKTIAKEDFAILFNNRNP